MEYSVQQNAESEVVIQKNVEIAVESVVVQESASLPAAAITFDLEEFDDVFSSEYVVKHPITDEPTNMVFVLAGPEHPARKKETFKRIRYTRQEFANKGKYVPQDPETEDAETTDLVGRCILGWSGVFKGGVAVPYSKNEAITLVTNPKKRWLRDQVKAALDERELFIKTCAGK